MATRGNRKHIFVFSGFVIFLIFTVDIFVSWTGDQSVFPLKATKIVLLFSSNTVSTNPSTYSSSAVSHDFSSESPSPESSITEESTLKTPVQLDQRVEIDLDLLFDPVCDENFIDASNVTHKTKKALSEDNMLLRLADCEAYFDAMPISATSRETKPTMKLAFSHAVHFEIATLEMFLSTIYRPHNLHCIHVDIKSSPLIHLTVKTLANCYNKHFNNDHVMVVPRPIPVYWGHISVVDADMTCMRMMLDKAGNWSYYINLAGTELPLMTYDELEAMLIAANGSNMIESYELPSYYRSRISRYVQLERFDSSKYALKLVRTKYQHPEAPFNLSVHKGMKNVIINRQFAKFSLESPVALEFYDWIKDVYVPDEYFFQTLVRIRSIDYTRSQPVDFDDEMDTEQFGHPRVTFWVGGTRTKCGGRNIRGACNLGVRDLPRIWELKNVFVANKFNYDVDVWAPLCHWKHMRRKDFGGITLSNGSVAIKVSK